MTHAIFLLEQGEFVDRRDGTGRTLIGIHDALTHTAAKFWRYPPGTRGKRHAEHIQEELIVVLEVMPQSTSATRPNASAYAREGLRDSAPRGAPAPQ